MSSLQVQLPRTAQGLDLLSQQSLSMEYNQSGQGTNSPVDFETAVANLPAFNPPSKPLDPNSSDYFPLTRPEDDEWLTPLHCFVRKYCVEVFVATPEDVAAPCMGKRNPVTVDQVGIRCPYCSPERMVGKINEIDIPRARENGVVEVYLKAKHDMESTPKAEGETSQAPIVLPSDKRYTTAFTFHLMSQLQPCTFTEADRLGRRRGLEVGYAGLACRHCVGEYGSGRFFPSSVKTMSDASKTLDVVYKHMCKCKKCPPKVKNALIDLRRFHDSERSKMPFGNQRAFFTKIWSRLHDNDSVSPLPSLSSAVAPPVASMPMAMATLPPPIEMPPLDAEASKYEGSADSLPQMIASINRTNSVELMQNKVATESA